MLSYVEMTQCKTNKYGFTKDQDEKDKAVRLADVSTAGGCRSVHMYMNTKLPRHPLIKDYTNLNQINELTSLFELV